LFSSGAREQWRSSVWQTESCKYLYQLQNVPTKRAFSSRCEVDGSAGLSSRRSACSVLIYLVRSSLPPGLYFLLTLRILWSGIYWRCFIPQFVLFWVHLFLHTSNNFSFYSWVKIPDTFRVLSPVNLSGCLARFSTLLVGSAAVKPIPAPFT
jgi:hypothetical protein